MSTGSVDVSGMSGGNPDVILPGSAEPANDGEDEPCRAEDEHGSPEEPAPLVLQLGGHSSADRRRKNCRNDRLPSGVVGDQSKLAGDELDGCGDRQ